MTHWCEVVDVVVGFFFCVCADLEKNLLVIAQKHDSDASGRCIVYTEGEDHDVCGGGGAAQPRLVEL